MQLAYSIQNLEGKRRLTLKGVDPEVVEFLNLHISAFDRDSTVILDVDNRLTVDNLDTLQGKDRLDCLVNLRSVNYIRNLIGFFSAANQSLSEEGTFICCGEIAEQRKKRLYRKMPRGVRTVYYTFDYIGKRMMPKLPLLKKVYFFLTAGRNQVLTKVELLGRLVYCGFEIKGTQEINNKLYVILKKKKTVGELKERSYGLLFRMKRTGFKGKEITVYKFRSMYAYSEFLQEYIYTQNQLEKGGKFKDDFRVNMLGNLIRKLWIDELPMLYNLIKGEIKLVGVRPLSKHYLSLYGEEFAEKRKNFKPGLIPPYYADLPETIEEIVASENNYFKKYQENPIRTDFTYLFRALINIFFRKARSK